MLRNHLVVCIVCIGTIAHAAWVPVGPYGGNIRSIVASPSNGNIVWMMSNETTAKIVKSTDGGTTWSTLNQIGPMMVTPEAKELTIDPTNPDNLFAVSSAYLFRSTDGGNTWSTDTIIMSMLYGIVVHPTNSDTIFATGWGFDYATYSFQMAAYRSTDGGETWTYTVLDAIGSMSLGYDIAIAHSNPSVVVVCGVRMDAGSIPLIFKSTDGGASYMNISMTLPPGMVIRTVGIHPNDANIIYAGTSSGVIYRSTDGGSTWTPACTVPSCNYTLVTNPASPDFVLCGGSPYIYVSTNAGSTWTTMNSGLEEAHYFSLALHPIDTTVFYAGCSTGVFKTTDGGASWFDINNNLNLLSVSDFCVTPSSSSTIYCSVLGNGIYKSTDYGTTWTKLSIGITCGDICGLGVNYHNAESVIALEGSG